MAWRRRGVSAAGRPWGRAGCTGRRPAPPTPSRAVYSGRAAARGAAGGGRASRPRDAHRTARVRQVWTRPAERCICCRTLRKKNTAPRFNSGNSVEVRGARPRAGCAVRDAPAAVQGAGGRGVHAMMDIVLISICPLLPCCGGAGRAIDRCTGPRPMRRWCCITSRACSGGIRQRTAD